MSQFIHHFPAHRARRLRQSDWIRALVAENQLSLTGLIWPIFICEGENVTQEIPALPGVQRMSIDQAVIAANEAANLGLSAIALFPSTPQSLKTPDAKEALNPENLVNRATRAIKAAVPDIGIMLDVALDPYNSDGHDGILRDEQVLNDETLMVLEQQALVQAEAGADILGPSDMMDGRVGIIRRALEAHEFQNVMIMSYAAKFASCFYGPFREAVGAQAMLKGDKKSYQIAPENRNEAMRMIGRDIEEGADMVMVKPGMPYLDICRQAADQFNIPIFAYQVSGEYAMIMAAVQNGWLDRDKAIAESLLAFQRAGCQGVLSYFAFEIAQKLADPMGFA